MNTGFWDCLKRERDISIKPMFSGGKSEFRLITAIYLASRELKLLACRCRGGGVTANRQPYFFSPQVVQDFFPLHDFFFSRFFSAGNCPTLPLPLPPPPPPPPPVQKNNGPSSVLASRHPATDSQIFKDILRHESSSYYLYLRTTA